MKKKKDTVQFRFYHLPEDTFVFAKLGPSWIREYGKGIDYLHFHNILEIGVCRAGTGTMVFREQVCPYQEGDITIIPRRYPHTTNSTPGTFSHWEYLFINEDAFIHKIFAGPERRAHRQQMLDALNSDVLFFPRERYPELSRDILELMECMRTKQLLFQEEAEGILAALLPKVARIRAHSAVHAEQEGAGPASFIVIDAIDYISKNYSQAITVKDLARHCSISETHLRRLFATHMKLGIVEYINFIRVQQACQLLKETDSSIADISHQCGFATLSTFNRNFKRIMGESPCVWRSRPENFVQELLNYPIHSEYGW